MESKSSGKKPSRTVFTENVLSLMSRRNLSDAELGEKIGVSRITVWRWRTGKQEPMGKDRDSLAAALGVSVCRLFKAG